MLKNLGLIEFISLSGARYIKKNGGHPEVSIHTMHYSLQLWLSLLCIVLFSIVLSFFTGTPLETLYSLLSICILRYFSGGWHFRSMDLCVLFTTAVVLIIPQLPSLGIMWLVFMNVASLFLVVILAPTGHGQQFTSKTHRNIFKLIAIIIVLLNFIHVEYIVTISIFVQSITLITKKRGRRQI